ncbi:MAG: Crp/Fnr family transcriptional regulator [Bacteroidia bacterium]
MSSLIVPQIFETHTKRFVKKGEVLVEAGKPSKEAFYVIKGCLRSYIIDDKGKEHIYQFAPEDWIISDLEFFKDRKNALLTIDAIEDSEVRIVNPNEIYQLSKKNPELIEDALMKFQNRVYALQKRILQLLAYSAEERYKEFNATYPNLSNRIPLKMIASYLGLTPESLSRVRREIMKK